MMKEDAENLYNKLNSEFRYIKRGSRRILVDKLEPKLPCVKFRIRKKYIELYTQKQINKKIISQSLGRYIMGLIDKSMVIDHINQNPLDNRRCNLRITTQAINVLNKTRYNFTNKYKGVFPKRTNYMVEIHSNYKSYRLYIPISENEDEVAKIYDCLALKFNGSNHLTNFESSLYSDEIIEFIFNKYLPMLKIKDREYQKLKTQ